MLNPGRLEFGMLINGEWIVASLALYPGSLNTRLFACQTITYHFSQSINAPPNFTFQLILVV